MSQVPNPIPDILADPLDSEANTHRQTALYFAGILVLFGITGQITGIVGQLSSALGVDFQLRDVPYPIRFALFAIPAMYVMVEFQGAATRSIQRWAQTWESAYEDFKIYFVGIQSFKDGLEDSLESARKREEERLRAPLEASLARLLAAAARIRSDVDLLSSREAEIDREIRELRTQSEVHAGASPDQARDSVDSSPEQHIAALSAKLDEIHTKLDGLAASRAANVEEQNKIRAEIDGLPIIAREKISSKYDEFFSAELEQAYKRGSWGRNENPSPTASPLSPTREEEERRVAHRRNQRFLELRNNYERNPWKPWIPVALIALIEIGAVCIASQADDPNQPTRVSVAGAVQAFGQTLGDLGQQMVTESDQWRALARSESESWRKPRETLPRPVASSRSAFLLHGPRQNGLLAIALPYFELGQSSWDKLYDDSVRATLKSIATNWAACGSDTSKVWLHVVGYADRRCFGDDSPGSCTEWSDEENVVLANNRATAVRHALEAELGADLETRVEVSQHTWSTDQWGNRLLLYESGFAEGAYEIPRGQLSRRVEIRLLDSGICKRTEALEQIRTLAEPLPSEHRAAAAGQEDLANPARSSLKTSQAGSTTSKSES